MLCNGGAANGGKGASSSSSVVVVVVVVVACMLFLLAHLYIYYLSAREKFKTKCKAEKREKKIFLNFLVKKIHSRQQRKVVLVFEQKRVSSSLCTARKKTKKTFLARVVTFASARGAPFSRAEEARTWTGEWCDHTRGTRTAHARACIKKRALVSKFVFCFGKKSRKR